MSELKSALISFAQAAKAASRPVARADSRVRSQAIVAIADALRANQALIETANQADVAAAQAAGLSRAMCDRLVLQGARLQALEASVRDIAAQPDPVGEVTWRGHRPNGLLVSKVRIPLGVVMMIYESRPNVTVDAAALCIRSGNVAILRGGSEARRTNEALGAFIAQGLASAGLPTEAVNLVPTQAHEAIDLLLQLDELIDLVIPRGGEALIRKVAQTSRIPVIKHYKGVCHVFVDRDADLEKAERIVENAKVSRPGVCNALETLLVDAEVAELFVPKIVATLHRAGVRIRGCERSRALCNSLEPATEADWDTEFLDLVLALRVVDSVAAAIAHIDAHGSNHTASIVTQNQDTAARFTREVDCSCVLVNASTRFNDGGELGLGAEMGISTTRLHAYGAMGASALTIEKFVVEGEGQIRV